MLGLFGKKSDHPLADIKSVQALLDDLPKNDALKALLELSGLIESVREQEDFRLDHQVAVLRLLDEAAHPFARRLARDYFSSTALSTFQENRAWMALNEFFAQTQQAYLGVLGRYRNGGKGAAAIKGALPLLAARGIGAAAGRLKFAAVRYALVEPEAWVSLAEFYAHAEAQRYLDEPLAPYAGGGAKTSVRKEFAIALVWYASCFGTLGRLHLHLAERLAGHLGGTFTVSAQCEPVSRFSFDLQHPAPPARLGKETAPRPGLRFLGVGQLQPQVDALFKTLEKNAVPQEIDFGGEYEAGAVHAALRHLAECLILLPAARRNKRHNVTVNLSVANGFAGLMEQTSTGLDFSNGVGATWQVEDISSGGLRCTLPASGAAGVAIGLLMGTKPERVERWGAGIVRRITRDSQNNLHVGIETLASQVSGVTVRERDMDEERHALWLDRPGGDAGEVDLLMSPDTFTSSRSLHARLDGKSYLLMPLRVVERGEDFDLARYRKIEEEDSAEESY